MCDVEIHFSVFFFFLVNSFHAPEAGLWRRVSQTVTAVQRPLATTSAVQHHHGNLHVTVRTVRGGGGKCGGGYLHSWSETESVRVSTLVLMIRKLKKYFLKKILSKWSSFYYYLDENLALVKNFSMIIYSGLLFIIVQFYPDQYLLKLWM